MAWTVSDLKLRSTVDKGVSWNVEDPKLRSGADRDVSGTPVTVVAGLQTAAFAVLATTESGDCNVTAGTNTAAWAPLAPTVIPDMNVTAGLNTAVFAPLATTQTIDAVVTAGEQTAVFAPLVSTQSGIANVVATLVTAAFAVLAPTVEADANVTAGLNTASFATEALTVSTDVAIEANTLVLTSANLATTQSGDNNYVSNTQSATFTPLAPTVSFETNVIITANLQTAAFAILSSSQTADANVTAGLNTASFSNLSTTQSGGATVTTGTDSTLEITSNADQLYWIGGNERVGEKLISWSGVINKVDFRLKRGGSPVHDIVAKIYSQSGGLPDTVLQTSTTTITASSLTTDMNWYSFTFDGTNYTEDITIAIEISNVTTSDASNYFTTRVHTVNPYAGGSKQIYSGATWYNETGQDFALIVNPGEIASANFATLTPTVSGDTNVTAGLQSAVFDNLATTQSGDSNTTAGLQSAVFTQLTPTVIPETDVSAGLQTAVFNNPPVTVITATPVDVDAGLQTAVFATLTPALSGDANVALNLLGSGWVPLPVTVEVETIVEAGLNSATFNTLTPSLSGDANVTVGIQSSGWVPVSPTVSIDTDTIPVGVVSLYVMNIWVDVITEVDVDLNTLSATFATEVLTVSVDAVPVLGVQSASFSALATTVIGDANVVAGLQNATFTPLPIVFLGDAVITAGVVNANWAALATTVTVDQDLDLDAQVAVFATLAPTIIGDSSYTAETNTATFTPEPINIVIDSPSGEKYIISATKVDFDRSPTMEFLFPEELGYPSTTPGLDKGMVIFHSGNEGFWGWTGTVWVPFGGAAYGGWALYVDGSDKGIIADSEIVEFKGGTNVTLTYSPSNNAVTINSSAVTNNLQKTINSNYIMDSGDNFYTIFCDTSGGDFTITVNDDLIDNFECDFLNISTGIVTFVVGSSPAPTLNYPDGLVFSPYKVASLIKREANNEYWLKGELVVI